MATEDLHQYVTDDLKMRILYLEKEIEKLQNYIEKLEIKLKGNPFTRDTFRDNQFYGFQAI